ncbi:MAG: hypothetical protein HRT43_04560 [Campylobacteraceae bacterium]|nr:hypothetical protein [Campylobacteraceae bacterium]
MYIKKFLLVIVVFFIYGCSSSNTNMNASIAVEDVSKTTKSKIKEQVSKSSVLSIYERRKQHYLLAHRILPSMFYGDPQKFISKIKKDKKIFLQALWQLSGKITKQSMDIKEDSLDYKLITKADGTTIIIFIFPEPVAMTEAYFTAMVYKSSKEMNYLTMEFGMNIMTNEKRTVLGAWSKDKSHSNFGTGPKPSLENFMKIVLK